MAVPLNIQLPAKELGKPGENVQIIRSVPPDGISFYSPRLLALAWLLLALDAVLELEPVNGKTRCNSLLLPPSLCKTSFRINKYYKEKLTLIKS